VRRRPDQNLKTVGGNPVRVRVPSPAPYHKALKHHSLDSLIEAVVFHVAKLKQTGTRSSPATQTGGDAAGPPMEMVWSTFPADTSYFGSGPAGWMITYRMPDLDAMLAQLQAAGVCLTRWRRASLGASAGRSIQRATGSNSGSHQRAHRRQVAESKMLRRNHACSHVLRLV
jgi:hypothetical protein